MSKKTQYIIFKESLAQSIISDCVTFGLIALCIWLAWGDKVWTVVTLLTLLISLAAKAKMIVRYDTNTFYSLDELQSWLDEQKHMKEYLEEKNASKTVL